MILLCNRHKNWVQTGHEQAEQIQFRSHRAIVPCTMVCCHRALQRHKGRTDVGIFDLIFKLFLIWFPKEMKDFVIILYLNVYLHLSLFFSSLNNFEPIDTEGFICSLIDMRESNHKKSQGNNFCWFFHFPRNTVFLKKLSWKSGGVFEYWPISPLNA